MKAKEMAEAINVPENTFSRWKHTRPELYERIKKSFECEELIQKMGITIDEMKKAIEAYKSDIVK
jgi:plasmid maintenance system antidote protein VapI